MTMITTYFIAIILAAFALSRLPSGLRGRNRLVLGSALAIALAFGLVVPPIYESVERLIPAVANFPDLIAKLLLFTGLLLAATQVARAYEAPRAQRLISGLPGVVVFVALFAIDVLVFASVHTGARVPDLAANLDQPLVRLYSTIATAYPAYLFALLLPHVASGCRSSQLTVRVTSWLLSAGFALAIVRFGLGLLTLLAPDFYSPGQVVSGVAALLVACGLATAFFARLSRTRRTHLAKEA
jgi:hypothetical protein